VRFDCTTRYGDRGRMTLRCRRAVLGLAALLLIVAVVIALQPIDSGDNFCGNAFLTRGGVQRQFNGCDAATRKQRLAGGALAVMAVAAALLRVRCSRPN
jgi:hypothetical protein